MSLAKIRFLGAGNGWMDGDGLNEPSLSMNYDSHNYYGRDTATTYELRTYLHMLSSLRSC